MAMILAAGHPGGAASTPAVVGEKPEWESEWHLGFFGIQDMNEIWDKEQPAATAAEVKPEEAGAENDRNAHWDGDGEDLKPLPGVSDGDDEELPDVGPAEAGDSVPDKFVGRRHDTFKVNAISDSDDIADLYAHGAPAAMKAEEWLDLAEGPADKEKTAMLMLRGADVDGDGFLDTKEFVAGISRQVDLPESVLQAAFLVLDRNEDGRLDADELVTMRQAVRAATVADGARNLAVVLLALDMNGDLHLDREELQRAAFQSAGDDIGQVYRRILANFEMVDTSGDGRLDVGELEEAIGFMLIEQEPSL